MDSPLEEVMSKGNDLETDKIVVSEGEDDSKIDADVVDDNDDETVENADFNTSINPYDMSSSDDDDDDDSDNEEMKKLNNALDKDILLNYHPEIKKINHNELMALSKIVKNKYGIPIDPLHKTVPFLTKYEKARILGIRAKQINDGSDIFVEVPPNIFDGYTIALKELEEKKLPFIIKRPLPNGNCEYWNIQDLELI